MTTKQIEIMLTVAETLNFTRAAEMLFVSQPTLTYQIQSAEEEIGFKIFDRTQKAVRITPAGKSFIASMRKMKEEYRLYLEQAQNHSDKYDEDIVISLPYRSAIHLLPEAMMEMEEVSPTTLITPKFGWRNRLNDFLDGKVDILFEDYDVLKGLKGVEAIPFYRSRIYLVCSPDDELARKEVIHVDDLVSRTLMVGGGSQRVLRKVQEQVINKLHIPTLNSDDHDTTLTNIAAKRAIVLAPGFLHDRRDGFAWVPFECPQTIDCRLAVHEEDKRKCVRDFIDVLLELYEAVNISTL